MIIKSLLFVITLIFLYETIQTLYKLKEEYFTESFVSLKKQNNPNANKLNDISKTIAINCKEYPKKKNTIQTYEPINPIMLDTTEYVRFKPLEYNPNRKYYFRRDILIPEGIRRKMDDEKEIEKIKKLYDTEKDPTKKEILQDNLDLFKWRKNILAREDQNNGEPRSIRDIISDYYPEEIGMVRIWKEPHSHISDYSKQLNSGYKLKGYSDTQEKKQKPCNVSQISNVCIKPSLGIVYSNYENYSKTGLIL